MAAACIEYCMQIGDTHLLYDTLYDVFVQCDKQSLFLRLLEPYILNRLLTSVRPSVLQDLVEDFLSREESAELEMCILHLDPDTIRTDLHTLVTMCKKNNLLNGLVYLYNAGLNDYETPAKLLLELGNMELLLQYFKNSVKGCSFPFGHVIMDPVSRSFIRVAVLNFMLENLKAIAKILLVTENDINSILEILQDGLGTDQDEWEMKVIDSVKSLDFDEACKMCIRRLVLHPVLNLRDKTLVGHLIQVVVEEQDESKLVTVLRNIDADLYDVGMLTEQMQGLDWKLALTTVHENALQAAINDGQDLLRIQTVYEQILKVSPTPAHFVNNQLEHHTQSVVISEALNAAVMGNLAFLLGHDEEKELSAQILTHFVRSPDDLNDFPELQYRFMKRTMFEGGGDSKHLLLFIDEMCQFEPQLVASFLYDNEGSYPLDDVLELCQRRYVYDASAYLLERTGDIAGALDLLLKSVCVDSFEQKQRIIGEAIKLCERNSLTDLDTERAERLWFLLLNRVSNFTDESKVNQSVILRYVLNIMMSYVESGTILAKIQAESFGQIRNTVKCMMDARTYELQILGAAKALAVNDLITVVRKKHMNMGRGTIMSRVVPIKQRDRRLRKTSQLGWEEQMGSLLPSPLILDPP